MVPVRSTRLRLTLRQGTVYFMPHRGLSSPLPHFCVVVNFDPLSDEVLLLSVVTSNVSGRKELAVSRNQSMETIVEFGPDDYAPLDHASCIDCNDLKKMSASEFEDAVKSRAAVPEDDLPPPVLARVVAGILASTRIEQKIKALVSPQL